MATPAEELAGFYEGLIARSFPLLEGKVKVRIDRRITHDFEARRARQGNLVVNLTTRIIPNKNDPRWAEVILESGRACYQIYTGRTHARQINGNRGP